MVDKVADRVRRVKLVTSGLSLRGPAPEAARDGGRQRAERRPPAGKGGGHSSWCLSHPKVAHLPNPAHGSHMGRALNLKFWQPSCVLVLIRQLAGSGKFKVWSAGPGWWWVPSVPGSPEPGELLLPAAKPGQLPTPAAAAHGGLPTNTASPV